MPAGDVNYAVGIDRHGNDVCPQAPAFPQDVAGFEIVTAGFLGRADDHLCRAIVLHDEGRGPSRSFGPILAPEFLASAFVHRDDERIALVIPFDDQGVAVQRGR